MTTKAERFDEEFEEIKEYLEEIKEHVENCNIEDLVLRIDEFKDLECHLNGYLSILAQKFSRMTDDERKIRDKQLDELKDEYYDAIITKLKCTCSKK